MASSGGISSGDLNSSSSSIIISNGNTSTDPRLAARSRWGPPPVHTVDDSSDDQVELIDEVEWADKLEASGELAPRPRYDRDSDPCGCTPDNSGEPCCVDMSCVLYACQEECRSNCEAGDLCGNKRITRRQGKNVQVFDAGSKGKGLRALEDIRKGDFVAEYVGRAIRKGYLDMLFNRYRNERMLYIMALDKDVYIDARKKGGKARYINHSCEPNCVVERWKVRGILRAGVFAIRDIPSGEELSFDYKWDRKRGRAPTKCHCLAPTCRGTLEMPKSMEEDELERRLMGHWKKPIHAKAGREIINRSIKILSVEHHEYFSADVCKYDETNGQHLVIYRHDLEEVWEDLSKEDWMILDEEAEQFVIAKKSHRPVPASTSSLLHAGLATDDTERLRGLKNYLFVQTPVKDQFIARHLIERCQRNCHVTINIQQLYKATDLATSDDEEGMELQRALECSKDGSIWKLTVSGFDLAKACMILEKNVGYIEKLLQDSDVSRSSGSTSTNTGEEVIIPRCVVDGVKRRLPLIREQCRGVNVTFAASESKSKQFSRLILESTLPSDLETAKNNLWTQLVAVCCEANAPLSPSGIHKDLGFLGGEISSEQFRLLQEEESNRLNQGCNEDLRRSAFFASFESTHRCTVWVQSEEDKGRIDVNNRVVNEAVPNAPRKLYFGSPPKDVPRLFNLVQIRAADLARGVKYLHLGVDRMYQQFMLRKGGQLFDFIKSITGVSVTIDSMTGDHLRIDGRTQDAPKIDVEPWSESRRVALAEEIIRLQIELYRDHCIRQQNWIFGRDWSLSNPSIAATTPDPTSVTSKSPSRPATPSVRNQFESRAVASACVEIAEITSTLQLSGEVAAHASIIMYRFVNTVSDQDTANSQMKIRDLLLGSLFIANKAQKTTKWKRLDALLEAAYQIFYPGAKFDKNNEEVLILEKRVVAAETEILENLDYDVFWRGVDWILSAATPAIAEPLARNVLDHTLSGPVLAAGPALWLKYGIDYVFAAVAGFLSIDLEKLFPALSLIPLKVSQAAEIIANSVKTIANGKKGSTNSIFNGGNDAILNQVTHIREICIKCMSQGMVPGMGSDVREVSEVEKRYELIGKRDCRQRTFQGVPNFIVNDLIMPIIDGVCAESKCKIFVSENAGGGSKDVMLQGSWRALAIAEYLIKTLCESKLAVQRQNETQFHGILAATGNEVVPHEVPASQVPFHSLPDPVDGYSDKDLSSNLQAKGQAGLIGMSAVNTADGWEGTIQSRVLNEAPSWGRKVGGKCCVAGRILESSMREVGLRWWIPPRYGPSPTGSICDMFCIRRSVDDSVKHLDSLARLVNDLMGVSASTIFPSLSSLPQQENCSSDKLNNRYVAVSLQRWPSDKVTSREKGKSAKMSQTGNETDFGFSPAALQEMQLLTQLHSLIPSPQGHPNFILPIAVALPHKENESGKAPEPETNESGFGMPHDEDFFSLFRTSAENEKVAKKEKKRKDLATGPHLVFHPTPFILQRFTSRSKRIKGSDKDDQALSSSLLAAWFHDLLSSLVHCHMNHVILRNLQPDQIMIDHSGVAKLGGLYRATVLSAEERKKSPNPLRGARSRKDKNDDTNDDATTNSYIAPEILLGSVKHTKESDIWSMGCLMAHLLLNKPLFIGKDRASLLISIFKIVGTPNKENYPEAVKFPFFEEPPKKYKRGVQKAIRYMMGEEEAKKDALALDLLEHMLHLDPKKRITAVDALQHEYMARYIENCDSDGFRQEYVRDWLSLKQKLMESNKSADDEALKEEKNIKRQAMLMAASSAMEQDDDDLYDMDDLLGDGNKNGGKKQRKTSF